jgi:hypothetical protein
VRPEDLVGFTASAPELVVLGADEYRMRIVPLRGVIEAWEALIEGNLAARIQCQFDQWDVPVEFRI